MIDPLNYKTIASSTHTWGPIIHKSTDSWVSSFRKCKFCDATIYAIFNPSSFVSGVDVTIQIADVGCSSIACCPCEQNVMMDALE